MKDIFFQEKGKAILLALAGREGQYVTEVAEGTKGAYAHTFNLIRTMEEAGVVEASKQGRVRYITLTPRGREMAALLERFCALLDGKGAREEEKSRKGSKARPADAKLVHYRDALGAILQQVRRKRPARKELRKYPRLLGRYRSLIHRLRPKGEEGRKMKADLISSMGEIEAALKGAGA
ncbi:MAG: hypothetical protein AABX40_02755 [Candidatus Hydrothermarchaeota archaeon]